MKAWIVSEDAEGHSAVVFATSRGQAKGIGARELDEEFVDVTIRRAPEFDKHAPGPVSIGTLLSAGWFYDCGRCGRQVYADTDGAIIREKEVYCSAECEARVADAAKRWEAMPK